MKVLIADDHTLVRDTLAAFLRQDGDIDVVTCSNYHDACDLAEAEHPDILILDYYMPGIDGLGAIKEAVAKFPEIKIALMSGDLTKDEAQKAISSGAAGFLPKSIPPETMVNALRFIQSGEIYFPFKFEQPLAKTKNPFPDLTQREQEILGFLASGATNKEIARELDLAEVTIKLHVKTLLRKIGAKNRTQAAVIATQT